MSNANSPIIDLRTADEYISGHLVHATNIPLAEIDQCWHELPPKQTPLDLCVNQNDLQQAEQLFSSQHYPINNIFIAQQLDQSQLQQGTESRRLWLANPLLEQHIDRIKTHTRTKQPIAFDIGCGSGRDSVFLAIHGFQVKAIDNNHLALQRLTHFAKRWSVEVDQIALDCEADPDTLADLIKKHSPQLIIQSRYLHRPLLDIYREHLPSGSMIAVHTFFKEAAKFGKPRNPTFLLERNELAEKFHDWIILLDEVYSLNDGRPLSLFLAKNP